MAEAGIVAGAMYKPAVVIVPTLESLPGVWFTCQVTAVLLVPVTVAINCRLEPTPIVNEVGETVIETFDVRVTEAEAVLVLSASATAVTVIEEAGTVPGAMYKPAGVMVPTLESPPGVWFTSQVTAALFVPVTVAINCRLEPTPIVNEVGETVIETFEGGD